jgi:UDP-3-O-[3-hydroxymyristoyl] glucosamine N-acyltransferase
VVVESNATIADNVIIMARCCIGQSVKTETNIVLHGPIGVMDFCEIESQTTLSSGARRGSDGSGYETVNDVQTKLCTLQMW